jgi:hypothetical protein
MVATFNGTWDWTAVGTLALAAATFVSLFFARRSIKQTQQQIKLGQAQLEQTQREIELSRTEVEEAHRPVLIPTVIPRLPSLRTRHIPGQEPPTHPERPSVTEPGVLGVQVHNIGSGPALHVEASVERLDEQGNLYGGANEPQTLGEVTGIGKDQAVSIEIRYHGWEDRWNFRLKLAYEDVAGKRWATVASYIAERQRYEGIAFPVL